MGNVVGGLFGGDDGADAAREAAEQRAREEAERQARIQQGLTSINEAFAGFTPEFYDTRTQAFTGYYNPQLQEQYTDARKKLTLDLARAGLLNSRVANENFADLDRQLALQQGSIQNRAAQDVAEFQRQVAAERNALVSQLNATANPDIAGSSALAASNALQGLSPTFSPLATVITPAVIGATNFLEGRSRRGEGQLASTDPRQVGRTINVG